MLREKRKTNTIWFHSYVELKKPNKWTLLGKREANQETDFLTIEDKLMVTGGEVGRGGLGEIGDGD